MSIVKFKYSLLCILFITIFVVHVSAQEKNEVSTSSLYKDDSNNSRYFSNEPTGNPFWSQGETDSKKIMRYSLLVGTPVVTIAYGSKIWNWGENKSWRWAHERWFQKDTDSGGADKMGHCFSFYAIERFSYSLFSYSEQNQRRALLYSGFTAALAGTLVEVGDAFTGRYGFSYQDLISDYVGILIGLILDKYPVLDSFVGFTLEYCPSKGFKNDKDKTFLNFAGDYSGMKSVLSFKLGGFEYIGLDIPDFFRYVQLDVGYYTRDYTDYDEAIGRNNARRYWYYGISINMREIAKDIFLFNRKAAWLSEQPFKYYHAPIGYKNEDVINP